MHSILQQAARIDDRRVALGLDSKQLLGTSIAQRADAGQHLRPGDVTGGGHGYFKLAQGREGDVISADGVKGMPFVSCHSLSSVCVHDRIFRKLV